MNVLSLRLVGAIGGRNFARSSFSQQALSVTRTRAHNVSLCPLSHILNSVDCKISIGETSEGIQKRFGIISTRININDLGNPDRNLKWLYLSRVL